MQVITLDKKEYVVKRWNEILAKAEKRLANSKKCYEVFGDEDSKKWIEEDLAAIEDIKNKILQKSVKLLYNNKIHF